MDICGLTITSSHLSQLGLILGIAGSVVLAFSTKVGTVSKDGQIIFNGLDPIRPTEENKKKVERSHKLNRYFTPIGWFLLATAFGLQFAATL